MEITSEEKNKKAYQITQISKEIIKAHENFANPDQEEQAKKITEMGKIARELEKNKWDWQGALDEIKSLHSNQKIPEYLRQKAIQEYALLNFQHLNKELQKSVEPSTTLNILKNIANIAKENQEHRTIRNSTLEEEIKKTMKLLEPLLKSDKPLIKRKVEEINETISKQPADANHPRF
jgi:hypothetical protein